MVDAAPKKSLFKNKFFLVGGGVAAILVAYEYKKQKTASASTAASATTVSTDPTIDPSTGIPYASEDYSAATGGAIGSPYGSAGGTVNISPVVGTNTSWSQTATQALVALGFDSTQVATALGTYLNNPGAGLSQDELNIVQAAIGQEGSPPTPVPAPTLTNPSGQSGGTTGGTPSVTGSPRDTSQSAYQAGAGSGLWATYQANPGSVQDQHNYENGYNNWVYQNTGGALGAVQP